MNHPSLLSRRTLLLRAAALSAFGLTARLPGLSLIADAAAQNASDYKALVCVFMFGGNDGNNTVIPLDSAGYASYAKVRPESSGINLAQASLLPIQPAGSSIAYGLHPALAELQTLFAQGRLAVLANVGTLVAPTTRAQYDAGRGRCRCTRIPTSRRSGKAAFPMPRQARDGAGAWPTRSQATTPRAAFPSSPRSTARCCSPPAAVRRHFPFPCRDRSPCRGTTAAPQPPRA